MKIRIERKKLRTSILLFFLYFAPIIDNVLGASMRSMGEDTYLGKVYRFFFLGVLLTFYLLMISRKEMIKFIIFSTFIVVLPIVYSCINMTVSGLVIDYIQISKLFYPIILYKSTELLIQRQYMKPEDIQICIKYYMWFYPLSLFIPYLLGVGYQSYKRYGAGYSGFYGAGNEISIVLVTMYILTLAQLISQKRFKYFLLILIDLFTILLTGSKAALFILGVGTIVIMLHSKRIEVKVRRIIEIFIFCVPVVGGVLTVMKPQMQKIINMFRFKYNQLGGSLIDFVFSNRNNKIIPNFETAILHNQNGIINFLIGRGYYHQTIVTKTSEHLASAGLIEMDLFDCFFQHGVFITIGVVFFYVRKILEVYSEEKWSIHYAAILMMVYGLLAGHTFQSTMTGTTLILMMICMKYA